MRFQSGALGFVQKRVVAENTNASLSGLVYDKGDQITNLEMAFCIDRAFIARITEQ